MSRSLNKVMLIGNVGNEPEIKHTPAGIPVSTFRLATSESRKDKDGNPIEHTDWHTIVAWRGLADVVQRLVQRGSRIFIEGKIQTRTFDDKTGTKRKVVEIVAETILLLDTKKAKSMNGTESATRYSLNEDDHVEVFDEHVIIEEDYKIDDEIPF